MDDHFDPVTLMTLPLPDGEGMVFEVTSLDGVRVFEKLVYDQEPAQTNAALVCAHLYERFGSAASYDVRRPTAQDLADVETMRELVKPSR